MAELKTGWVCPKDRCTNWEREIVPKCRAHHCTMVPADPQPADEAFRVMLAALTHITLPSAVCNTLQESHTVLIGLKDIARDAMAKVEELQRG